MSRLLTGISVSIGWGIRGQYGHEYGAGPLCLLFDLAVRKAYAKKAFFRFVYHDGILETKDDCKKIALLKLLMEFSTETGEQSIFT